ncbi:MAG: cation transporting ATPase C-terminal domain-containing protein [Euryarchaeota archaeon]|nr:cation transporting ATPase C-terminal domain-containing protein [Euryarchaeota archaeon]
MVDWLKVKPVKKGKLPEEVMTEDDIKRIAGDAYAARYKAFILSMYESGCRIGEFLPVKLKHLTFDKYGGVFRVTGKTGDRRIRLVASTLSLQGWLNEHPAKSNPEAYLWCKIPSQNNPKWINGHLSYGFISRLLNELAEKAGITKAVNPQAFRHSRATFMARHLKEGDIGVAMGKTGTDMAPAIALGTEKPDPDVMARPPRRRGERILTRSILLRSYLFLGPIEAIAAMSGYYYVLKSGGWSYGMSLSNVDPLYLKATTIALAAIIVTQVANGLTCRTTRESLFKVDIFTNRYLLIGIAIEIILIFLIVYAPPFQHIFRTVPLYLNDWLIILPFAALLLFADELRKWLARRSFS